MLLLASPCAVVKCVSLPAFQRYIPLLRVPNHNPPSASSWIDQTFSSASAAVAASCANTPARRWLSPRPVPILRQRPRAEVGQPIVHLVVHKAVPVPVTHSLVGAKPKTPVAALHRCADKVIHQAIARRQPQDLPVRDANQPIAIGPNPQ